MGGQRAWGQLMESYTGRGSQDNEHLVLNQVDFCPFCCWNDILLPTPKTTDSTASTVALCLIHSLSSASHRNIAK